jgi:hypothetical protein
MAPEALPAYPSTLSVPKDSGRTARPETDVAVFVPGSTDVPYLEFIGDNQGRICGSMIASHPVGGFESRRSLSAKAKKSEKASEKFIVGNNVKFPSNSSEIVITEWIYRRESFQFLFC